MAAYVACVEYVAYRIRQGHPAYCMRTWAAYRIRQGHLAYYMRTWAAYRMRQGHLAYCMRTWAAYRIRYTPPPRPDVQARGVTIETMTLKLSSPSSPVGCKEGMCGCGWVGVGVGGGEGV